MLPTGFVAAGLDAAYRQARPKRLRFAIFTQVGRVVRPCRSAVYPSRPEGAGRPGLALAPTGVGAAVALIGQGAQLAESLREPCPLQPK